MRKLVIVLSVVVGLPVLAVALFLLVNSIPPAARSRLFITDEAGRALILHGLNVNGDGKTAAHHVDYTTHGDILRMSREWGFNVVRYLVFWDGIESQRGEYDEAYIDRVAERVQWCGEAGLRVILDMHQDLYAAGWGGNRSPLWAVEDDGLPVVPQSTWELTYLQPGVRAAISNFFDPARGRGDLGESFIAAFVHLVERFRGNPAVLGYDLYNEPFFADLGYFRFERRYLGPFYQRLIAAIRLADPNAWLFVEPMAVGPNHGFRSRLPRLQDPRMGEPRLAYFPHLCTLDLDLRAQYFGSPLFVTMWARARVREAARLGMPLLLGEFGFDGTREGAMDYVRAVLDVMERVGSGWTYWCFTSGNWGPIDPRGAERPLAAVLVQRAVAGEPLRWHWEEKQRTFVLEYRDRPGVSGPTEISLPASRLYPAGFVVTSDAPDANWSHSWDEEQQALSVIIAPSRGTHRIVIRPDDRQ